MKRISFALFAFVISSFCVYSQTTPVNPDSNSHKIQFKKDSTIKRKAPLRTTPEMKIATLEAKIRKNDKAIEDLKKQIDKYEEVNSEASSEIKSIKRKSFDEKKHSKKENERINKSKNKRFNSRVSEDSENTTRHKTPQNEEIKGLRKEIKELKESIQELKKDLKK